MKNVSVEVWGARGKEYTAVVSVANCPVYRIDFMRTSIKESGKLGGYEKSAGAGAIIDRLLQGRIDEIGCPIKLNGIW